MMKIRRYLAADHDAVWELHNFALLLAGAYGGNGPWDDDLHRVDDEYIATGGEFYVGTVGGRIVAMGGLQRLCDDRAELRRMRVHPDVQRRGLGRQMLSALEAAGNRLGLPDVDSGHDRSTGAGDPAVHTEWVQGGRQEQERKLQDLGVREENRIVAPGGGLGMESHSDRRISQFLRQDRTRYYMLPR